MRLAMRNMIDNLVNVILLDAGRKLLYDILWIVGERSKAWITEDGAHRVDLCLQTASDSNIDRPASFQDLNARRHVFSEAKTMNPVNGLEVMGRIKRPVHVDRVVTSFVKTDAFAARG